MSSLRGKNRILRLLSFLKRGKWDICVGACVSLISTFEPISYNCCATKGYSNVSNALLISYNQKQKHGGRANFEAGAILSPCTSTSEAKYANIT